MVEIKEINEQAKENIEREDENSANPDEDEQKSRIAAMKKAQKPKQKYIRYMDIH